MEFIVLSQPESRNCELTERQMEILRCLVSGSPAKEIARDLNISVHTVNAHLREVYLKLRARGRVDATRWYFSQYRLDSVPA